MEKNGVRSKPFILSRTIHQSSLPLSIHYVVVLEPFFRELKANPVPRRIRLPGDTILARYSACSDDVIKLQTEKVSKEIR